LKFTRATQCKAIFGITYLYGIQFGAAQILFNNPITPVLFIIGLVRVKKKMKADHSCKFMQKNIMQEDLDWRILTGHP
jgi:hypothetical protein